MPNVFFVTQGKTYWFECRDGYIWAPIPFRGDRVFWRNVELVKVGDVIIHFAGTINGGISAISQATTDCFISPITQELREIAKGTHGVGFDYPNGRRVDCSYVPLQNKMPINTFSDVIRRFKRKRNSAFNINCGVNQGYLYELEHPIAYAMIKKAVELNPYLKTFKFIVNVLNDLERN